MISSRSKLLRATQVPDDRRKRLADWSRSSRVTMRKAKLITTCSLNAWLPHLHQLSASKVVKAKIDAASALPKNGN